MFRGFYARYGLSGNTESVWLDFGSGALFLSRHGLASEAALHEVPTAVGLASEATLHGVPTAVGLASEAALHGWRPTYSTNLHASKPNAARIRAR